MRPLLALILLGCSVFLALAQDDAAKLERRYLFEVNLGRFPQKTPQEALKSILRAVDERKVDYLLAHLADPAYVDAKVKDYALIYKQGPPEARELVAFERLVSEVESHFRSDPSLLADLRRYHKEGEWEVAGEAASVKLPNVAGRKAFFKKIGERWFLENRQE